MRNKIAFIALLLLSSVWLKAQNGEIIYRDFEPDVVTEHDDDSIPIDFDGDGFTDVSLVLASISTGYRFGLIAFGEWNISFVENDDTLRPILEITDWYSLLSWTPDFYVENLIVRKNIGDGYCFGWFRAYNGYISYPNGGFKSYIGLDKYAYCPIPDYPLIWGQTSLTGIEEKDKPSTFATIHPNPTNGQITVIGENLQQAEVFNMLGQQLLTVQGSGNELYINMTACPAGIYFIAVTNEEGRKCVQKVVRE